ncbi:tellurium resistance membrane protein [Corynebacterium renale]|uniref:Tellurite resistance protein TerC n=1 Tax=Corynebacterium renale TaxID=1724 RepID=A0A2A9DPC5_9CORY|nr:TerC family protein [Corynebacterium renale]PFG28538.1 tellurite resistance protein TerC [Corynebacterium renale]SQG64868.1 tellurium resistance membrane protein [Corynebacterium renale]SQI26244.1 tellurium resistance membrane protein [Corynebacterium renale]STC96479.1 tellurium resistance membrane protein [Corynebacterium renale]
MSVPLWVWIITIVVILGFFVFDFYSHVRTPHEPTMKESATWSVVYIALAVIFGVFVWIVWDHQHGIEYFTGYILEKSLSVDNLFVFALIMAAFQIPRKYQQKVLLIGIALALGFRLIFILLGASIINAWSDVFYLFAIFLIFTAVKMLVDEVKDAPPKDPKDMVAVKLVSKVIPVTDHYESDHLITHKKGKKHFTPLMIALVSIGVVDVMFALDSIPAIYGVTQEAYLVFTTNAFSLLGLRQLYFLLDGLLDRLVYLSYGLSLILGFIGVKLLLHALHNNNLPFINGGDDVSVPEIPTLISLGVIVAILTVTVIASLIKSARDRRGTKTIKESEPA